MNSTSFKEKNPLTPFQFYLTIRRVEMKDEAAKKGESVGPDVQKMIGQEWNQLDEGKKKHFNIPAEV